jgi:hypothetical protein
VPEALDLVGATLRGTAGQVINLAGAVANAPYDWTINGTPNVLMDISDARHELLRTGTRARPVLDVDNDGRLDGALSIKVAGERFVSTGIVKSDGGEQLRLIHWIAHELDQVDSYRSSPVGAGARAQFVSSMVRECPVQIPAYISAITAPPAVTASSSRKHRSQVAERDAHRGRGFADGASFKIQGETADAEQLRFLTVGLSAIDDEPKRPTIAYLCAVIVESRARNLSGGDGSSSGGLQVTETTAKRMRLDPRDGAATARAFVKTGFTDRVGATEYSRRHPSASTAEIAQHCQGSAFPQRYKTKDGIDIEAEAEAIYKAWGGAESAEASSEQDGVFERGSKDGPEGTYTAAQRLGGEVGEYVFIAQGGFYYQPGSVLVASRPAVTLSESHPAVETIRWEADDRVQVRRMQIELRADVSTLLQLAARTVIVEGEGEIARGAGDDRWLVTGISMQAIGEQRATIEVQQPQELQPEPKASSSTSMSARAAGSAATTRQFDDPRVVRGRRRADQITAKRYPYVWGGGHGSFSGPYDCSGACSAVIHAMDPAMMPAPLATGDLINWGKPGEGETFTLWVKNVASDTASHAYMTFKSSSGALRIFESGSRATGRTTGWRSGAPHPRPGFEPRHWDGL